MISTSSKVTAKQNAKARAERLSGPRKVYRDLLALAFRLITRLMRLELDEQAPRAWSNRQLKKFAHLFRGDIVNVSGWEDADKEGNSYASYFINKNCYCITNKGGQSGEVLEGQVYLDLEEDLPESLRRAYDVVFNHTTLEHIFEVRKAFTSVCEMSRDIVILVVPFMQVEHWHSESFLDYWRFTEFGVEALFQENGLELLYLESNHNPVHPIYFFAIGSRRPEDWGTISAMQQEGSRCERQATSRPVSRGFENML